MCLNLSEVYVLWNLGVFLYILKLCQNIEAMPLFTRETKFFWLLKFVQYGIFLCSNESNVSKRLRDYISMNLYWGFEQTELVEYNIRYRIRDFNNKFLKWLNIDSFRDKEGLCTHVSC